MKNYKYKGYLLYIYLFITYYSIFKAWFCMEPYKKVIFSTKKGSAIVTSQKKPFLVLFRTIFLKSVQNQNQRRTLQKMNKTGTLGEHLVFAGKIHKIQQIQQNNYNAITSWTIKTMTATQNLSCFNELEHLKQQNGFNK